MRPELHIPASGGGRRREHHRNETRHAHDGRARQSLGARWTLTQSFFSDVGAPSALSLLEGEIAMNALFDRFSSIEITTSAIDWCDAFYLRGPKRLPVRVG